MKGKQRWMMTFSVLMGLFLFAGMASAHVTVQPPDVAANSYQVFTVRVPSESKGVSTTKVQVKIAEGAAVSRVEPKVGWAHELEKNADGAIIGVTWTAEGTGLSETEFTEFRMSGKVSEDAKELVWKAYQTYSDSSVVEWTGAAGSDKPAAVQVVTAAAGGDGHGAATTDTKDEAGSILPTILSAVAVVLAAAALVVAVRRKR